MKVYEAVFREEEETGIYALSVVENPAMEDLWITLSEHPKKVELAAVDEEKRLLLGAALIPDKKIYRNIDGNEFYITFSEQTIEKLAHSFFKNQYNNNSSLEHEIKLEGMSVVEGWTVQDPVKDKSANYGKEYPKGTFVTMMKVDNDEMWEKAKSGEIKGFSIDALLGLQELKLNIEPMNKETQESLKDEILNGIKAFFTSNKEEVKEEVVEEVVETQPEAQPEAQEPEFDKEAFMKNVIETVKAEFSAQKEDLDVKLSEKDKEIESLKAELAKQPEVNEIKSKPEVKKEKVELTKPRTTHARAMQNIANAMGW